MRVYAYLRASSKEQKVERARQDLENFSKRMKLSVSCWFTENESGTHLHRPELFRLLQVAELGDVLLVEQVDRITRLSTSDWELLREEITRKGIKIVSLDLPTSHQFVKQEDEFTNRISQAINQMMLDILAAVARKDFEDRRRRQAQGVKRAKAEGKYKGRPDDLVLQSKIEELLKIDKTYSQIQNLIGCSRHTISKVKKKIRINESQE